MTSKPPDIDSAYGLEGPEDNRRLYANWAASYDKTFAADHAYVLPDTVATAFIKTGGSGPVLDVGAGTGLLGQALMKRGMGPVDGTDISPEMLAVAAGKKVYDRLFESDATSRIDADDESYGGVVSAGTFTHGHLGPEVFDELLRVAAPEAHFAIAINAAHFESAGFAARLDSLAPHITERSRTAVRIYGPGREGPHADDMAIIALFRKN
jgi:predicted TPR repeat methyltransferase